jgi:hypothetical protein
MEGREKDTEDQAFMRHARFSLMRRRKPGQMTIE